VDGERTPAERIFFPLGNANLGESIGEVREKVRVVLVQVTLEKVRLLLITGEGKL